MSITRSLLETTLAQIADLSTKCYVRYITGLTKEHQRQMSDLMGSMALCEYMLTELVTSDANDDLVEFEGKRLMGVFEDLRKKVDRLWPHLNYKK